MAILVYEHKQYAAFIGDDSYNHHSWEEQKLPGPIYDIQSMKKTLRWVKQLSEDPHCIDIYADHENV